MARLVYVTVYGANKFVGHLAGAEGTGPALTSVGEALSVVFERKFVEPQSSLYLTKKGSPDSLDEADKLDGLFEEGADQLMLELHGAGEAPASAPSTATAVDKLVSRLETAVAALEIVPKTPSVAFSAVSPKHFAALCRQRRIRTLSAPLPDLTSYRPAADPSPHAWRYREGNKEAPFLHKELMDWTQGDLPAEQQRCFVDVHADRSRLYCCEEPGAGKFTGVPDTLILGAGIGPEAEVLFSCDAIVDWKTSTRMSSDKSKISCQGGVLAIAAACDDLNGPPVFFSDLATGMRCFILIDGALFQFHTKDQDLSLRDGVALLRYFLRHRGTVHDAFRQLLRRLSARDGESPATGRTSQPVQAPAGPSEAGGSNTSTSKSAQPAAGGGPSDGATGTRSAGSSPGDPQAFATEYSLYLDAAVEDVARSLSVSCKVSSHETRNYLEPEGRAP